MNIRKVKQGARITLVNGIYMILIGLFYNFFINLNMKINFNSISKLWGFFLRYSPQISYLFKIFNHFIGIFLISLGIIIIYLSYFIIKRKEKMTWAILFLSGIISWAGFLILSILLKNSLHIILAAFGWVSFVIGMVLPIKYYITKNYREY